MQEVTHMKLLFGLISVGLSTNDIS